MPLPPHPTRRYDAVICDIDGCLGPESAAPLDAAALLRIADYNQLAISRGDRPVVTVCSGRPQPFAEAICRLIHNSVVPCVAENGVWLFDPRDGAFLRDPSITAADIHAVHEASEWIERTLGPSGIVIQPGKSASISLWHENTDFLRSTVPTLVQTFRERSWPFRVSMTVAWINCDLAHVSKATGIDRLTARSGLTGPRLAGIGDMPSDMAIADRVGFFACPSNGHADLRPRAAYVSPFSEVDGVIDILGKFIA
jgi:hydroxymethylpyrimidine pyrophosphatase-like HAD family hydrolase